nr:PREDICTED: dickkopf-related protein 4 [Latimeria chalumnae]|eukprot:XP_014345471.1 PREDICTED: dickkopf-related protein 4 [Latimeria chalumnae]
MLHKYLSIPSADYPLFEVELDALDIWQLYLFINIGSICLADSDCSPGKFCLKPRDAESACATCRAVRKRCQRNTMCCPGMLCVNDVCTQAEEVGPIKEGDVRDQEDPNSRFSTLETPHQIREKKKKTNAKSQRKKGQESQSCLRTSDCASGLCCARHFWTKICKPVLTEGEVCSKRGRKDVPQGPELFQRCDCGPGLTCRTQSSPIITRKSRLRVCQRS